MLNGHSVEPSEIGSIHEPEDRSQDQRKQLQVNGDTAHALAIPDALAPNIDGLEGLQSVDPVGDDGGPGVDSIIHTQ